MRQQDAFELLLHLFKLISVSKHPTDEANPVSSFRFCLEQRLQCLSCRKVRYKLDVQDNISVPVPARRLNPDAAATDRDQAFERVTLKECLDIFTSDEQVKLNCSGCGSTEGFRKRYRFRTLPPNLIVNAQRFEVINWVPTKLNIPVEVGDGPFDMSPYMSLGPQDGEELLPEESPSKPSVQFNPNPEALNLLLGMGFPEVRVHKALRATGNADQDAALNWLFSHMDDPDIDDPIEIAPPVSTSAEDEGKIARLGEMGIEPARARRALRETSGDVNRALDWVFSHPDEADLPDTAADLSDANATQSYPGSSELPAEFELQSILCHKGISVHTG
jgi:ubiquitin carboxyl-terminal hydrolase 5/13